MNACGIIWALGQIMGVCDIPALQFRMTSIHPKSVPLTPPTTFKYSLAQEGVSQAGFERIYALPVRLDCASSSVPVRDCPPTAQGDGSIESTLTQPETIHPHGKGQRVCAAEPQWGWDKPQGSSFPGQPSPNVPPTPNPTLFWEAEAPQNPQSPSPQSRAPKPPPGRALRCRASVFDAGAS